MTANTMSIAGTAVLGSRTASARHLNGIVAMALGAVLYAVFMAYLLIGSMGTWTSTRPADAPFSIPAPIVVQSPSADQAASHVSSRPQPGFAPR